ncbi:GTP-binding protein A [Stylophora pistillata]|uniref:GTP-binding protein A n=2 Tax=Stylophora pistillata TaxID=50429 RepID=A0A2B4RES5_STYPI|nr:GTP-binding protein A [Stylophora pistillata]
MTILLCGKTGVGKSHLTNALIGKRLAKEGEDLDPETYEVKPYNFIMNGVGITVVDTPGLADGSGNEEVYLQRVKEEVTGFDAFIFCTEMNTHRIRNEDIKTIQKLAEAFGPELWKHAVVALTFANEVHPPPSKRDVMEQEFFDDYLRKFKRKIQQVLLDVGVPEETMIKVPFVPTGDLCEPQLPGIENWIVCFWIATFKRLNRSAQPTFLLANINRFNYDSGREGSVSPGISLPRPELKEENKQQKPLKRKSFQGFHRVNRGQRPWDDQNAEINSNRRVLNRSQSMNEGKQRTPQETLPKPKPKAKRSSNEQGPDTDTIVGIDLDEASAGEIMMEILDEVGIEDNKIRGDFIRPGTGNLLSIIFEWFMTFFKKWLLREPSTTNEAVEEEESQEQEGN